MIKRKRPNDCRLDKIWVIQFRRENEYLEPVPGTPDALVYMLAQVGSDAMHLIMDRRSTASLTLGLRVREPSTRVKKRTDDR